MAFSTISTLSSNSFISNIISVPHTYSNFIFPSDLGVTTNTIDSENYNYSNGSGSTLWRNGTYSFMSTYNNTVYSCYKIFSNDSSKFCMSGVQSSNSSTIYDSSSNSAIAGNNLTYTRVAYNSGGAYIGGTSLVSQNVITTYNISSTSAGEFIQVKFPFKFILQKFSISLANNNTFGPKNIRVLGSNDNITWSQVYFLIFNGTYTQDVLVLLFNISGENFTPYFHHRFIWEMNKGGNIIILRKAIIEGSAETL